MRLTTFDFDYDLENEFNELRCRFDPDSEDKIEAVKPQIKDIFGQIESILDKEYLGENTKKKEKGRIGGNTTLYGHCYEYEKVENSPERKVFSARANLSYSLCYRKIFGNKEGANVNLNIRDCHSDRILRVYDKIRKMEGLKWEEDAREALKRFNYLREGVVKPLLL